MASTSAGELAEQQRCGAVGDDGDLAWGVAGDGVDHGAEAGELGVFEAGGAAALDDDDEGEAEGVGVFVEVDGLRNAIVFNDKLLGLEVVDHLAVLGLHGGGDENYVGLGFEGVALVGRWREGLLRQGG